MMNRKIFFSIFILMFLAFCSISVTYAYFVNKSDDYIVEIYAVGEQTIIPVNNEIDIIEYAKASEFNDSEKISGVSRRFILKLSQDIILTSPLVITNDINIDLNGKILNLNGYNLEIQHNYYSFVSITNGQIINTRDNGKLILSTPNSSYLLPEGVIAPSLWKFSNYVDIDYENKKEALAEKIFEIIGFMLLEGDTLFYHYSDLPLMTNYYNYPVTFSYNSSNQSIINNFGRMINNSQISYITITAILDMDGWQISQGYDIVVLPPDNIAWVNIVAPLIFDRSISNFLIEEDYLIEKDIMLITKNQYAGITFEYISENPNDLDNNRLLHEGPSRDIVITVKAQNASGFNEFERIFKVISSYSNFNRADDVVELIAGEDKIISVIETNYGVYIENENNSNSFALPDINDLTSGDFAEYGITSVSYSLIGNDNFYLLQNNNLSVNTENMPTVLDSVFLVVNLTFSSGIPLNVTRRINIVFNPLDDGDDIDKYRPYFLFLNNRLVEVTNGLFTYKSFYMPKQHGKCYFSYTLFITLADGTTYQSTSSADIVYVDNSGEQTKIEINIDLIPIEGLSVEVRYGFTFDLAQNYVSPAYKYLSFDIYGIVRNNSAGIPDETLYDAIKLAYGDTEEPYLLSYFLEAEKQTFSLTGITINNTFKGLEFLINTYELLLSNTGFSSTDFQYIEDLNRLITLDLSNNGIIDISNFPLLPSLRYLDLSYNSIDLFTRLEKMTYLNTLDVHNNLINDINGYGCFGIYNSYTFIYLTNLEVTVNTAVNTAYDIPDGHLELARVLGAFLFQTANGTYTNIIARLPVSVYGGGKLFALEYPNISVARRLFGVQVSFNYEGSVISVIRVVSY